MRPRVPLPMGQKRSTARVVMRPSFNSKRRCCSGETVVSAVTGAVVFAIARVAGLDLAVAIAILTFVLNFIPSIGSIVATAMVAVVALVQTNDPGLAAALFAVVGIVQFTIGNVIDPMLMGHALRLSSFGIIISLAFWGAVWGLPGMFLAVPIMVATMIACSSVPVLRPLAVLLSREGLPEEVAPRAPVVQD